MRENIIKDQQLTLLPPEVHEAYDIARNAFVFPLEGGLVSQTSLVVDGERELILQRMGDVLTTDSIDDMEAVTNHLSKTNWEVPLVLRTNDNANHVTDVMGGMWRATNYIPSDRDTPDRVSLGTSGDIGALLGRWHRSMADFTAPLAQPALHLHDTEHHASKLETYLDELPGPRTQRLGERVLRLYNVAISEDDDPAQQVIHGDPKLANILFRDGNPVTLIDFDMVMRRSRWTDIGDFLRSLSGKLLLTNSNPSFHIAHFADRYSAEFSASESRRDFVDKAHAATGKVALTLAMRYLCDIVESSYFTWDQQKYASRRDNHLERAHLQTVVAQNVLRRRAA